MKNDLRAVNTLAAAVRSYKILNWKLNKRRKLGRKRRKLVIDFRKHRHNSDVD